MSANEVTDLMGALRSGEMSLDEVVARVQASDVAEDAGPASRSYAELAEAAQLRSGSERARVD